MIRFVQNYVGKIYRVLLETDGGMWLISFSAPASPVFITSTDGFQLIETPFGFLKARKRILTKEEKRRKALIQPLLDADGHCITDKDYRLQVSRNIAEMAGTTTRRVLRIFYQYLATGSFRTHAERKKKSRLDYDWAIKKFYFSTKRMSLRAAYEMMLLRIYTDKNKQLCANAPTWNSFQWYFYMNGYHKKPEKMVTRENLPHYQLNCRSAFDFSSIWGDQAGVYQINATETEVYLVSQFDRNAVIGRPYIYLAVDTATQLIAGVYVGLETRELAVLKCLENAVCDKVQFCKRYDIDISPEQWPNIGIPTSIITDKERDFCSGRVKDFCDRYGVERQSLRSFRPARKSLVEKMFDLMQNYFKPFRVQAVLDLDEFTEIVIHTILYLNAGRCLPNGKTPAEAWCDASPLLLEPDTSELHHFFCSE